MLRRTAGLHLKRSSRREIQVSRPKAYGWVSFTQIGAESRGLTKKLFIKVAIVLSEVQFCNKGWCISVTYEFPNNRLCLNEKTWRWGIIQPSSWGAVFCLFFCTTLELATVGYVFRKTNLYASSRKWILGALSFYTEPLLSAHKANLGRFLFSIYRTFQLIGQWCVSFFSFLIPSLSDLEYHCLKSWG